MDDTEQIRYEPITITLEMGKHTDALSIASALAHFFLERRGKSEFCISVEDEADAYEDIRMVGEALLSAYQAYKRANEVREKYRR